MIKYKIKHKIVNCEKIESVTSHNLYPLPLSQTVTLSQTPPPLERDILYGRPLYIYINTNLLECLNDWTLSFSDKKSISIAYIDFKSAFDCISHSKLLLKLTSYGIKGNLYLWIQAFLNNRSQYVKINSSYSLPCSVSSGVIQGSVIGSLLFNIFINDLTDNFHSNTIVKLFADDIKLYTSYTNISQNNLQHEINTIYNWASIWQMQISYSKCNILHISSNTPPQYYKIDSNIIAVVDSVTDLGVIIDADLRFKHHLNNIVLKANQRSALIKRSFLSKNTSNLIRAFKIYVRPILEYASTTWSPSYISQINQIESVQRHFTKSISDLKHLPYTTRLSTLKLQSLEHRRLIADLTMCYNIIHNNNCLNTTTFFTLNTTSITRGHPLRISVPIARLNVRQHFFAHRVVPIWNSLSTEIVMASSTNQFKSRIKQINLSKFLILPTYYNKIE